MEKAPVGSLGSFGLSCGSGAPNRAGLRGLRLVGGSLWDCELWFVGFGFVVIG